MIDETGAWLTWALNNGYDLPRIPRRRVDFGGFERLLQNPGAKAAVNYWWMRTLERIGNLTNK